ncbi:substrate-binding periplasmic protein [Marinomonas sp. PE14-40]|uniref:substrate-binding periplasmic protein n=1 Tax=Marinomonas sp. PE14-40 TaxID=3060621 RepID=UPI003F66DCA8
MRFVCFTLFIFFTSSLHALTLTFAFEDKQQPPYYLGEGSKVLENQPGIAVEMLQILDKRMPEFEIKFIRMPWKRALYSLKSNRVDGIFNASYKTERLDFGWYPTKDFQLSGPIDTDRRITSISYSLYHLKSSPINWSGDWQDLKTELVGAPLGYSIVGDLQKKGIKVEQSSSTKSNLLMLSTKRMKVVALQTVTADSFLSSQSKNTNYNAIEKLSPPLVSKPYYLMLSKSFVAEHPTLSQKIWNEIKLIREEHSSALYTAYQE